MAIPFRQEAVRDAPLQLSDLDAGGGQHGQRLGKAVAACRGGARQLETDEQAARVRVDLDELRSRTAEMEIEAQDTARVCPWTTSRLGCVAPDLLLVRVAVERERDEPDGPVHGSCFARREKHDIPGDEPGLRFEEAGRVAEIAAELVAQFRAIESCRQRYCRGLEHLLGHCVLVRPHACLQNRRFVNVH